MSPPPKVNILPDAIRQSQLISTVHYTKEHEVVVGNSLVITFVLVTTKNENCLSFCGWDGKRRQIFDSLGLFSISVCSE